jgi:hypothetical protein
MPFGKFKVVLIDEADYMNKDSVQPALRNLMEDYSQTVRFILTCNYPTRSLHPYTVVVKGFTLSKLITQSSLLVWPLCCWKNVEFDMDDTGQLCQGHIS